MVVLTSGVSTVAALAAQENTTIYPLSLWFGYSGATQRRLKPVLQTSTSRFGHKKAQKSQNNPPILIFEHFVPFCGLRCPGGVGALEEKVALAPVPDDEDHIT